eukprot:TRINITY_DN8213_c0_g1_i1.p1 TRINITY_DN8213_c0_g1~~TRINITY_DN8213_c0_g1_i1.p1  ORF type:complete len:259 (-),score=2.47 TRINITY_DN8213_c0_g1_i1:23-799(-)
MARLITGISIVLVSSICILKIGIISRIFHSCLSDFTSIPQTDLGDSCSFEAGIVLGYALNGDGSLSKQLKYRVNKGVELLLKNQVKCLIMSGANPFTHKNLTITEAKAMQEYANQLIMQEQSADQSQFYLDKILLEEQSTSTRENAMFSLLLLEKSEFQEILIITNKFHQLRSYLTFVQAGVDLQLRSNFTIARIAHDIDNSITEGFQGLYVFVRELAAIIYYTAKGYVNHQGFNCILLGLFGAIIIGSVRIYGKSRA